MPIKEPVSRILHGVLIKKNLAFDVIQLWMEDGDESNIDRVGHRRWCLNPSMEKTGFGFMDGYGAMYAFNEGKNFDVDYVPWPAKTMPYKYFLGLGLLV